MPYTPLDRLAAIWHTGAMAFWAYLLRCADGSLYAGHTDHLERRLAMHDTGKGSDYTARRQPVTLAWAQDFPSRLEALEAERQVKGWSRAKKEALIAGDWDRVSRLAVAYAARPSTGSGRTEEGIATSNTVRPEPVEGRATHAVGTKDGTASVPDTGRAELVQATVPIATVGR